MIDDRRQYRGMIWNLDDLCRTFRLARPGQMPTGELDIDAFIYSGFRTAGTPFLAAIEGRYACVHLDPVQRVLFLARDWIGEVPFHWLATRRGFVVANSVAALRTAAGDAYSYRYVRAFPQSKCLEIDLSGVDERCVSETCRYRADALYYDFGRDCQEAHRHGGRLLITPHLHVVHDALERSIHQRSGDLPGNARVAVLLSGGLDSLSVAMLLRILDVPFTAYTLSVEDGGDDVQMAAEFARRLGVDHNIVKVTAHDIIAAAPAVVEIAETYHLYNFFCSVGMYLLGRGLADAGISTAFCGEAVNEALGDYHDWSITDPKTGRERVLQHVNYDRMKNPSERLLYVWGQSSDRGKYNRQLGSGLAKHAGSRMFKPLMPVGLRLECPYYDREVLAHLVSLPASVLDSCGGKPGVFVRLFQQELEHFGFPSDLVQRCKKVRFQDASEGGRGGITPVLLEAGYDQERLIALFNDRFGANLDVKLETQRLVAVTA